MLRFNPALPEEVKEMSFNVLYRHHWLKVTIKHELLAIASQGRNHGIISIGVRDEVRELEPGQTLEFILQEERVAEETGAGG